MNESGLWDRSPISTANRPLSLKSALLSEGTTLFGNTFHPKGVILEGIHSTEFQALHDPEIVLGSESKLNPDIPSYSIFPPSYSVLRRDRNAFGGGVFQAIKSDLANIEESNFNVDVCETPRSSQNCK